MLQLVYSCYLIKHGDDYMVWDTGQPSTAGPLAPKVGLVDQDALHKLVPGISLQTPKSFFNNLAPRVGFAWDVTGRGRWVVSRGGVNT